MNNQIDQKRFQEFGYLEFLAKQIVEGFITGLHKSPFHGFSVEFAEHRLYNAGESIKHIDWKLYGRTDRLFVKRFEEETNLRCQFVLDNSSSMYFPVKMHASIEDPDKITFSVFAVATLMFLLRKQRDAVGLSVFSEKVELHTQAKSSSIHHKHLIQELEQLLHPPDVSDHRKTLASEALHQIADNIHKRSLVVIFSDMMETSNHADELFHALQHLRHNKHEVVLFHVVDKNKELDFTFDNRPYKFIDLESGQEVKIRPNEVKEKYIKAIGEYKNELKLKCMQYRIDFVEADINKGFNQILIPYLLKRERLY